MSYLIFALLFGLAIGSFLNVLIYRIPEGKSISFPASHCPKCHKPLKIWHNIPLFSWIFLRGRCAFCKTSISFQYPLVELLSGIIFVAVYLSLDWNLYALLTSLTLVLLLALSIIDWRYKAVPDSLNLLALSLAIMTDPLNTLPNALLFAGGFTLLRFILSYYLYKKFHYLEVRKKPASWRKLYHPLPFSFEAMGEADIIVAATIGALLGVQMGLLAIFISALLTLPVALVRKSVDIQTPYIPFLSGALFLVFFFEEKFQSWLEFLYV
ncbi:MAG: prepilin peptidase [Thiovulaceae bacterium]|nr:prepilin peptidase [Sulfurimonadaceae bacterium]